MVPNTKYSEALGARFLDESGVQQWAIMGCYGIGVTRTLQAIIEQSNDKDGIIWPLTVAPYAVCVTPLTVTPGSPAMNLAESIYRDLVERGVEVILDDREDRPGVKSELDLIKPTSIETMLHSGPCPRQPPPERMPEFIVQ